jgi:hypothetical protein
LEKLPNDMRGDVTRCSSNKDSTFLTHI